MKPDPRPIEEFFGPELTADGAWRDLRKLLFAGAPDDAEVWLSGEAMTVAELRKLPVRRVRGAGLSTGIGPPHRDRFARVVVLVGDDKAHLISACQRLLGDLQPNLWLSSRGEDHGLYHLIWRLDGWADAVEVHIASLALAESFRGEAKVTAFDPDARWSEDVEGMAHAGLQLPQTDHDLATMLNARHDRLFAVQELLAVADPDRLKRKQLRRMQREVEQELNEEEKGPVQLPEEDLWREITSDGDDEEFGTVHEAGSSGSP